MKSSAIFRIVIFSVLAIVLMGALFTGIAFRALRSDRTDPGATEATTFPVEANGALRFPADSVRSLEIDWAAGNIVIERTSETEISVSEDNSDPKNPMVVSTSGDTLNIKDRKDNKGSILKSAQRKDLYISIPNGWQGKVLTVNCASTAVTMRNMDWDSANINSASGHCDFIDCRIGTLDIDTASSDLFFTGSLMELDMDGASASAVLNIRNQPRKLSVDSMSGKLDLTLPADCGFELKTDSLSGKANLDQEAQIRDGRYIYGDGACKIDVDGVSTTVNVHKGTENVQEF